VVHLASGRDLDVAAVASDRVSKGAPRLADVYADAADPSR
jgi:NADH:ubiquinone oxidoreductase subunit B-like Fe-S oxidoreductase